MQPGSSLLTFSYSGSSFTTYVDEVSLQYVVEPFQRVEFLNEKLRDAPTAAGALPIIERNIANSPIQFGVVCTGDSPRPLGPTSTTNLANANQRLNIARLTLKGAPTLSNQLYQLTVLSLAHQKLLNNFQYHQTKGNSEISYTDLVALQAETFNFLQVTGLNVTGDSLGGTVSDCLIRDMSVDVAYEVTLAGGAKQLIQTWSMSLDKITISSQSV